MHSNVDYPVLPRLVVQLKDFPKAAGRYVTTRFDRKLPLLTTWKFIGLNSSAWECLNRFDKCVNILVWRRVAGV